MPLVVPLGSCPVRCWLFDISWYQMEKVRTVQEEQPSSDVFRPGRDSFFADPDSSPIPSRIYDILQVVLETLLGSLPVPCSKTGAVLSWYESHQSTVPISYVIIGVIFLSVVVITLHSPTQVRSSQIRTCPCAAT